MRATRGHAMELALIRNGHHLLAGPFMIIIVLGGVILFVISRSRTRGISRRSTAASRHLAQHDVMSNSSAERILSERFARGELDLGEYRERLVALREHPVDHDDKGQAPTA